MNKVILYEFSFRDTTNLSRKGVLKAATKSLKEEALLQRWNPKFEVKEVKPPVCCGEEKEYFFQVHGSYLGE